MGTTYLVLWLAGVGTGALGAGEWLPADAPVAVGLVVAESAPESDRAAADLFARYWKLLTGREVARGTTPAEGANVWVGSTGLPGPLRHPLNLEKLGADGVRIKTFDSAKGLPGRHLVLAGEGERGTAYAVYEFLDRFMGVKWLAPDCTHVPAGQKAVPEIDYTFTPVFEHRDSTYFSGTHGTEFEQAHRISRNPSFGLFVHTAYTWVSPDKYKDHPEYFALVGGARRVPAGITIDWPDGIAKNIDRIGQLCWTNPDLPGVIFAELKEAIRKNPSARIWSVSQMDWANNCECDRCQAVDREEGSPSGSLLTCINAVADRMATELPGYFVETLAYQYTRKAPRHIRPRDNVIVRLCSIECDFARPLDSPEASQNALFAQDIREWSRIAKTLYIWDYTPNFRCFQTPHPNFHVLQPNLKFFAAHNVKGMFEQGCPSPGGEFAHLRRYIIGKCMWDPDSDAGAIQKEFLSLYYREAAPAVEEYIRLITDRVLTSGQMMTCFDDLRWMDTETVARARELFRQAFEAAKTDDVRQRLVEASMPVELAARICPPKVEARGDVFVAERPSCMEMEHYVQLLKSFGVTEPVEAKGFDRFRETYNDELYPRYRSSRIEKLENEAFELWVTPDLYGSIIRLRDKRRDVELLQGFRNYGSGHGTWEEWTDTPGVLERPVASAYEVVDRTPDTLVLMTHTAEGLQVRRALTLASGSDRLEVAVTIENPTGTPLAPCVKIHPEFYAPSKEPPEVWVHDGATWLHLNKDADPRQAAFGAYRARGNSTKQAFRLPGPGLTLVNEFDPANVGSLLYFFNVNPGGEQINLELLPARDPLAPGESRTLKATYRVTEQPPDRL